MSVRKPRFIEADESEANETEIHGFGYGKLTDNKVTKACNGRTFDNDRKTIIIRVCKIARISLKSRKFESFISK